MSRTDSQLWTEKLTGAFNGFDIDGDGYITVGDLEAFEERGAQALGRNADSPTYARYTQEARAWRDQLVSQFDKNSDDRIDREEFLSFWGNASTDQVADLAQHYAAAVCVLADDDQDNQLSKDEYVRWATASQNIGQEDAEAGFTALDTNGNGYLTKDEIVRAFLEFTTAVDEAPANEMYGPVGQETSYQKDCW
jgi:Ca2+-binding EF-hand superfamily protein